MAQECVDLHELADELEIELRIVREGNRLELFFESTADREYFQHQAFTPDLKTHTITFDDPDFILTWLAEVGPVMQAARAADYELYVVGDRVRFSTQDPDAYALFTRFEQQGMFNGPNGGREHWEQTMSRDDVRSAFAELGTTRDAGIAVAEPPKQPGELEHLEQLMERVNERTGRDGHQNGRSFGLN